MRKFLFVLGFLLLIGIFLHPLLRSSFYDSHDGVLHVARFVAYYQAFQDGQFPARWAGNLNFGYGTPVLIFYYPLPGYLASLLHHVSGLSFEFIFKSFMVVSSILAPLFFYCWARKIFRKEVAVLGALFYGLAPYHFLNLYVRGDIAEIIAFVFVPLIFWAIEKVRKSGKFLYAVLGGIFYALLILSHNGVSLMFSPVIGLYIVVLIWQSQHKRSLIFHFSSLIFLGLALAAFFWIPALYEGRYVNAQLFIGSLYQDHFLTPFQLIFTPWGFGTSVGAIGGIAPQIGPLVAILVLVSGFLWLRTMKERSMHGLWLIVFAAAVFITLPFSHFLWSNLAILRLYEFPWRFVGLMTFAAIVLACFVFEKIQDRRFFIIIGILLIVTSLPFVQVSRYLARDESYYASFTGTTYYHGEASPIWTAGDPGDFAKQQIEFIAGEGTIHNVVKKTHEHTFQVEATAPVKLVDNTLYFPGWKVAIDGQEVPIQFQDPNYRGLITFEVPAGTHAVLVHFTETKPRLLADILSLGALLFVLFFFAKMLLSRKK